MDLMLRASHLFLVIWLTALQCVAPLLHAHFSEGQEPGGVHLHLGVGSHDDSGETVLSSPSDAGDSLFVGLEQGERDQGFVPLPSHRLLTAVYAHREPLPAHTSTRAQPAWPRLTFHYPQAPPLILA